MASQYSRVFQTIKTLRSQKEIIQDCSKLRVSIRNTYKHSIIIIMSEMAQHQKIDGIQSKLIYKYSPHQYQLISISTHYIFHKDIYLILLNTALRMAQQKEHQASTEQHHEKAKFTVPGRDDLIDLIKNLDQDIQHVSLNLIKCDFNATEKDVEKAFPDFNLIKVKNYNPGSFQVVFQMKIDAINFIKKCYDKKILNRRFFIKMGRQHKDTVQDWTGVGYVPKEFMHSMKPHHNKGQHHGNNNNKKPYVKHDRKQQTKAEHSPEATTKPVEGDSEKKARKGSLTMTTEQISEQVKKNDHLQQQVKETQKKTFKVIPKVDYKKKNSGYHNNKKEANKQAISELDGAKIEGQQKPQQQQQQKPKTINHTNKADHKKNIKKPEENAKVETKPAEKQQQKPKPKAPEPQQQEDDGWIQVPAKPKNNRKR